MAIASYIAGAKGIFEFTRFDQSKPGILKKLGPLTNDAIGALVAGASSNMYSGAYRRMTTMIEEQKKTQPKPSWSKNRAPSKHAKHATLQSAHQF